MVDSPYTALRNGRRSGVLSHCKGPIEGGKSRSLANLVASLKVNENGVPEHREGHAAAVLDRQMLVWGGAVVESGKKTSYMSSETIWSLNLRNSVWSKETAKFRREVDVPIPSSASKIAVASNRCIYHYGGVHPSPRQFGSLAYTSNLHTLDPSTFEWRIVRRTSPWPHGRSGCGLCLLGDEGNRVLVVFGGRGDEISSLATGASWIPATGLYREYNGFNNELWAFSLGDGIAAGL